MKQLFYTATTYRSTFARCHQYSIWPTNLHHVPCILGVSCEKQLGRRRAVPVIFVQGTHYEVGYDVVSIKTI